MTGDSIRQIRTDLAMEPAQFAQLLGVHPSSLYRWENAGSAAVRIDPLQLQLLTVLQQQINDRAAQARADLGKVILTGLLLGGGLLGLFYLLDAAYGDQRRPRESDADPSDDEPHVGVSRGRRHAPRRSGDGRS
jgi:hypothetical protein